MYKKIKTISGIININMIHDKIYAINDNSNICEYSCIGQLNWQSEFSTNWGFCHFTDDLILYTLKQGNEDFFILDRKTKKLLKHEKQNLYIGNEECFYKNILYYFDDECTYIYDLQKFMLFDVNPNIKNGLTCFITEKYIISSDYTNIYEHNRNDISLCWQKDLSKNIIRDNGEVGEINDVVQYHDSMIVLTQACSLRINMDTGEILWRAKGYARRIEIVGNIGYITGGLFLYKINLDTGIVSGYGWKYDSLPKITYRGKEYSPNGSKIVFHEGLLWYSMESHGESFLLAINPQNGNYEWIHHVDTNEQTDPPFFYEDMMYITDIGPNLHIYKREESDK